MEEVILTQEQLQERLEYWQGKLRLRDWIITAKIKRLVEFEVTGRAGEIHALYESREAAIKILDPMDWNGSDGFPLNDMEHTLVHELLHIHTMPINKDKEDIGGGCVFEEQAIESITRALLSLDRE
ncbi:hypothetical protein [Shouchella miscanthi]|uniref:hypothetical protein n=1 Tax=Shouchella miscanthi TaxID=2598861 RepID=UPI0011A94ADE|nr:hypothetical protein [Shouchella miscanthi]